MPNKLLISAVIVLAVLVLFRLSTLRNYPDSANFQVQGEISSNPYLYRDQIVFYLGRYKISAAYQNLEYGDKVAINGKKTGFEIQANKVNEVKKGQLEQSLFDLRKDLDQRIASHFPDPQAQLLSGILLGVKSSLSKEFKANLVNTGTIHVVVVSGYNIVIIGSFVLFLAPFLGRKKTTVLALLTIAFYTLLVGFSAPTLRALIMGAVALVAVLLGRRTLALYTLFLTALVMLLINPDYLVDISFQLSFAATLGVLVFTSSFQKRFKKLPKLVSEPLATTLAAQILVLPLIFYYFGQISLISPVANTLVLWTVPLVTILGFVFLAATAVAGFLANLISYVLILPLTFFTATVSYLGQVSFFVLTLEKSNLVTVAGYYLVVLALGLNSLTLRPRKQTNV